MAHLMGVSVPTVLKSSLTNTAPGCEAAGGVAVRQGSVQQHIGQSKCY